MWLNSLGRGNQKAFLGGSQRTRHRGQDRRQQPDAGPQALQTGQPTQDGMFQIKTVECLGSCGTAPMFQIGDKYYENLTFEKIDTILDELRAENKYSRYV